MHRFLRAFWPMLLWLAFVLFMSTDIGASKHTSQFIGPVLRWLFPAWSPAAIDHAHAVIRKAGHVFEYAVMAILVLRALTLLRGARGGWSWPLGFAAIAIAALCAGVDESYQSLFASRGPSATDVLIDTCGAVLGVLLCYAWSRNVRRREQLAAAAA